MKYINNGALLMGLFFFSLISLYSFRLAEREENKEYINSSFKFLKPIKLGRQINKHQASPSEHKILASSKSNAVPRLQAIAPKLTSNSANYITENSAIVGGNITDQGSSAIQTRGVVFSEKSNPTIETATMIPDDAVGIGYYSELIGLKPSTTYFLRAYALNNDTIGYGNQISFTSQAIDTTIPPTFTDPRDGQVYPIKKIGGAVWMTKNLNYKKFSPPEYFTSNGVIYQGNFTMRDSIAPPGWHVAFQGDWRFLFNYFGSTDDYFQIYNTGEAAKALLSTSEGGTNSSGFNASFDHNAPAGTGYYSKSGFYPNDWPSNYWYYYFSSTNISESYGNADNYTGSRGLYIRCVKNPNVVLPIEDPVDSSIGAYKIIDPNPSVIKLDGTIDPSLTGLDTSHIVTGSATDGSKLLIYAESTTPITFEIFDKQDGTLQKLGDNGSGQTRVTIAPDSKRKAVAVYNAPDGFGTIYSGQSSRQAIIKCTYSGGQSMFIRLKLVSPPVVLVHGMWSDPSVWSVGGFISALNSSGFNHIYQADYHKANYKTYNPYDNESIEGRTAVAKAIAEGISFYRDKKQLNVAVSQVDVIGHSLGGLMARSYAAMPEFINQDNYNKGYIHKLITLSTPHRGSPLGYELWEHKRNIFILAFRGVMSIGAAMGLNSMKIGTCHRDFGIASSAQGALPQTPPFKTFAVQASAGDQVKTLSDLNIACWPVFYKSFNSIMASRCGIPSPLPNDLIVPLSSQQGNTTNLVKGALFNSTAHLAFLSTTTSVTNSQAVQSEVIKRLLSNVSNDFGTGFPAPSSLPLDCNTTTNRATDVDSMDNKKDKTTKRLSYIGNQAIHISSPTKGSVYQQGSGTPVILSFEATGGAMPINSFFMVEGIGWFAAPANPPYSVSFSLTNATKTGRLHMIALVQDSSGFTLGDTSSIVIKPQGVLQNMTASPANITLDSTYHERALYIEGTFLDGSKTSVVNLSDAGAGTIYSTGKNNVVTVNTEGSVIAIGVGTDTITITNAGRIIKVPVTVASNFLHAVYFANTIDFPAISDKQVTDDPFVLDASANSGEDVNFKILSGPATINNGVITVNGIGHVVVQATSAANSYFSAAAPVVQSFDVIGALPLTFLSFSGELIGKDGYLKWQTVQEQNTSSFVVERSKDGITFDPVGNIAAAGFAVGTSSYQFIDKNIRTMTVPRLLYRLKQLDKDGKFNLSNTVIINLAELSNKITVTPNPASDYIKITIPASLLKISMFSIYDMRGELVLHQRLSAVTNGQINISNISQGSYHLLFFSNDGSVAQKQTLVVQR